ncbi:hypothetical protein Pfo_006636 [Paulownia fortunei]|nr:hypothetical protein Pfo_006636 [Paulownia fortunei]
MLHLLNCLSPPPLQASSLFSINKQKDSIFLSGSTVLGVDEPLAFKKSRRNGNFGPLSAVEKDSGFEVDPDKAREALRKLDEQLQSLSKKQVDPPKIRALDLNKASPRLTEETSEFSGSFLAYAASALLVFTIFYNIIFLTVIKPSIDGEEPVSATSIIKDTQEGASLKQLSTSPEVPVEP